MRLPRREVPVTIRIEMVKVAVDGYWRAERTGTLGIADGYAGDKEGDKTRGPVAQLDRAFVS